MDTRIKIYSMLFLSYLTFIGCPRESILEDKIYRQKIIFLPKELVIKIQDTLWIESRFSCKKMLNITTNQQEDYCDAMVSSTVRILSLVSINSDLKTTPSPAVANFTYVSSKGKIYTDNSINPEVVKQLSFSYQNEEYVLKVGLIPQNRGKYCLGLSSGIGFAKGQAKAGFIFTRLNEDNHIELLIDFIYPEIITSNDIQGSYCFEVQ